jgi:dTMP kinase
MFDIKTLYHPPLQGKGVFVVIEGLDGAGKSIQATRLIDRIIKDGRIGGVNDIHGMRQPTNESYGRKIREFATSSNERIPLVEFALFFADRMEQAGSVRDKVLHGETVVMDRCYHTSVAYQSVNGALDPWDIHHANRIVFPKPDLFIFIDVHPDVALERLSLRRGGKEIFEEADFLSASRDVYRELVNREDGTLIDGDGSIDQVEDRIWKAFKSFMARHPRREDTQSWSDQP